MFCFTTTLTILKDFAKWFSEVLVDVSKRPVLSSLLLSLLLLFLVSLYKYYNIVRPTRKDFWHLVVEIPIDISLIFSTVFISFNVRGVICLCNLYADIDFYICAVYASQNLY